MARRRKPAPDDIPPTGLRANPIVRLLLADVVVRNAARLLRNPAAQRFIAGKLGMAKSDVPAPNPGLPQRLAAMAVMRLATRSLPGAALVGAGWLTHNLYKRGKARRLARHQAQNPITQGANPAPEQPGT